MIVGVGIDLVAIDRVRGLVERHGERGRRRLFAEGELKDCDGRIDPAECLAARFAAKEAALKALGTGKRPGLRWTEIEVVEGEGGRPDLALSGGVRARAERLGVTRVWVSLTHEGGVAGAIVVMESG
ncbi:MAG: holo-ACP synthase [Gemmatimonadetes bacterium]|uniref:Holo-[acyl-carrier-protein] synthase n=1 Tax=Candidatus Kutchimonas denitrificans TaxID=3056748 RepID=A0AAE4ZB30_9BACT|nr:holo-ACP synthase [Gemmatimonadota bacterium]NIR75546.1 holo-ACP synthase [Candidatus Kutchimonas denitrificans]NIS01860.1 holo-ACP synthase [Gemmatimonadota bacterium]NIT67641.1 holo-ACP synthase [Gemmatimonadota bacterium]NIU53515.1 holo-ACP synthase [Gemmatimonadota bacterium]